MRFTKLAICSCLILLLGITKNNLAQSEIKTVDYCNLFDSMETYEGQIVRTKAILVYPVVTRVDGGDRYFYSIKCNNGDFFALSDFSGLENLILWEKEFKKNSFGKADSRFQVTLTGKFTSSKIIAKYGHLNWLRAKIDVFKIESIKNVNSRRKFPDIKAESPLLERGLSLISANESFVRYLSGIEFNREDIGELLSSNFILTSSKGNSINKEDFLAQNRDESAIRFTHEVKSIIEDKNDWKVSGTITITSNSSSIQKLNYENHFSFVKNYWKLTKSKIAKISLAGV